MASEKTPVLSDADLSSIIDMAWQDDTPFEAIALQFAVSEPQVIALMRASLKTRSFRVWRMRVRGRSAKHLSLHQGRHLIEQALPDQQGDKTGQPMTEAVLEFPLPDSPITRQSLR